MAKLKPKQPKPVKLTPSWMKSSGQLIRVKVLRDVTEHKAGDVIVICESDYVNLNRKGLVEHA